MVRFIYLKGMLSFRKLLVDLVSFELVNVQTDFDISTLREGKHIPALCVRIFRLRDFFLVTGLKEKAKKELRDHIKDKLEFLADKCFSLECLADVLDALEVTYKDSTTEPIRKVLLVFVCPNWLELFQCENSILFLERLPDISKDVMGHYVERPVVPRGRLGLPVVAAISSTNSYYELGEPKVTPVGSYQMLCALYPTKGAPDYVLTPVDPKIDIVTSGLGWMTPCADQISMMTSFGLSEVVRVDMHSDRGLLAWLYVQFENHRG